MSSIPNSAMPTAIATEDEEGGTQTLIQRAAEQAGRIAELARDNPKAAIAAGAAVAAGVAAAAIPMVRAARRKSANGSAAPKADAAPARKRSAARKPASRSAKKS